MNGEWKTLEARVEQMERRLNSVVQPSGGLSGLPSDVFAKSGPFSVLPAECAILYKNSSQAVVDATWTTLVSWTDLSDPAVGQWGLSVDSTAGLIYTGGTPGDAVFLLWASVLFESNSSGVRSVHINIADGTGQTGHTVPGVGFFSGVLNTVQVQHVRTIKTNVTANSIEVWHNRGANLDVQSAIFAVARLR